VVHALGPEPAGQPEQAVHLAHPGPQQVGVEQAGRVGPHRRPRPTRGPALQVEVPHVVGDLLLRQVGAVVDRPPTGWRGWTFTSRPRW